jgi:hypothetical protein
MMGIAPWITVGRGAMAMRFPATLFSPPFVTSIGVKGWAVFDLDTAIGYAFDFWSGRVFVDYPPEPLASPNYLELT